MKKVSLLAKELRVIRIRHEITRPQMAKELKITERELEAIETGKAEASDSFLSNVAVKYSKDRDSSDVLLAALKSAYVKSIPTVTFDLAPLSEAQRLRVLALRATLAEESAAAIAAQEEEKRKEKERRAAERAAKKQAEPEVKIEDMAA